MKKQKNNSHQIFVESFSNQFNETDNYGITIDSGTAIKKPELTYYSQSKGTIVTDSNYYSPIENYNALYPADFVRFRFKGFYYLASLIQDPIIGSVIDIISKDMVKKWGAISTDSNDNILDKISVIKDRLKELKIQDKVLYACRQTLLMGGCGLFIEINNESEGEDLKTPLVAKLNKSNIITNIKVVDPIWIIPTDFEASNPLSKSFYNPTIFSIINSQIHYTRIPKMIFQDLPDTIKPAYNFFGLSLAQKMEDKVRQYEEVYHNVRKIIRKMRTPVIQTDLSALFDMQCDEEEKQSIRARVERFKQGDNLTTFVLDKEREDFKDITANISGLSDIMATFAEAVSVTTQMPNTKLWGTAPKGMNATGESDMRNYWDMISGNQDKMIVPFMNYLIKLLWYEQFGEDRSDVVFVPNPIKETSELEKTQIAINKSLEYGNYLDRGVLDPQEIREQLNSNDNEFNNLGIDNNANNFDDFEDINRILAEGLINGNESETVTEINENGV